MLEEHKTFVSDKTRVLNQATREQLYETKICKSLKHLIIRALLAFFIWCLLVNFTCDAYLNMKNNYFKAQGNLRKLKQNVLTTETAEYTKFKESFEKTAYNGPAKCVSTKTNCTLYCRDGGVNYIDDDLRNLKYQCPNKDFSLILQNCKFTNGILTYTLFFIYDYTYIHFAITDSDLQTIEQSTFKHNSVKNLQTLILRNNLLTTLTATTFDGLGSLKYFEFVQQSLTATFNGEKFLKPMAASLEEALITQMTDNLEVINPKNWLQDSELSALVSLDMSNNNFQNSLTSTTFRTLIAVKNLILANCSLLTITEEIFAEIKDTLQYLDLSYNSLHTFDLEFFNLVALQNIKLNLTANEWNCDCEESEIIEFFQANIELTDTIICYEPKKWQHMELKQVIKECQDNVITTTTIPSTLYTNSPTTTTTEISSTTSNNLSTFSTITTEISNPPTTTEISTTSEDSTTKISSTKTSETSSEIHSTTETINISEDSSASTITTEISITSTLSQNTISIACHNNFNKTETTFWFYHIIFSITTLSASSVAIVIPDNLINFDILCFTNYKNYMNLSQLKYTISENIVNIKELISELTYIFCLITDSQVTVSPLQCQAHFVGIISQSWLSKSDKFWCIPIIIIISLIVLTSAVLIVYFTLRKYPIWLLNQNGRILRDDTSKHKIIILSKKSKQLKEIEGSNYLTASELNSQHIDSAENKISVYSSHHTVPDVRAPILPPCTKYGKASSSPYTQKSDVTSKYLSVQFNRFQSNIDKKSALYVSQHKVPDDKAPNLPPGCSHNILESKIIDSIQHIDEDPDYQIIDHYEVVTF